MSTHRIGDASNVATNVSSASPAVLTCLDSTVVKASTCVVLPPCYCVCVAVGTSSSKWLLVALIPCGMSHWKEGNDLGVE